MSHMDDPDTDDEQPMQVDQTSAAAAAGIFEEPEASKGNGVFKLQSFITHLGASIHAGHYVAHAR